MLLLATPLGDPRWALRGELLPEPHSVDLAGRDSGGMDFDLAGSKAAIRALLNRPLAEILAAQVPPTPTTGLGPFTLVGSVAVLTADDSMVVRQDTGYGLNTTTLAAVSTRFIQTFGDDYDQIAVFLSFSDRASLGALAYFQPVKNDIRGIGWPLFDRTAEFGSKSGRMQGVLNMKRINLYGRDAAGDKDNGLYPVWAQEAGHRWLVYFRHRREGEEKISEGLLGRQKSHWERGVESGGSIMDGYDWKENPDGSFTPGERSVKYGPLDQYGMGLRKPEDVPPFFLLQDIRDMTGNPVMFMSSTGKYQATKSMITVQDIIRGSGPREPATDPAAADLRMAVMLLGAPNVPASQLIGEAAQIDNTRRLWTEFYNVAGAGRGKVCTELLRPCRGEAFALDEVAISEGAAAPGADGTLAPGEPFALTVLVTNTGDKPARAEVQGRGQGLTFDGPVATELLEPTRNVRLTLTGRVDPRASCTSPVTVDLVVPGPRGASRALVDVPVGLLPKQVEGFEGGAAPAGWRVNPDNTDTGAEGRWAWGAPQRSMFNGFTLQVGAAFSGTGAFATGLSNRETDNVEGKTTLESPPLATGGVPSPLLVYNVYFVAAEFKDEVLVPSEAGHLRVEGSLDGKTWVEVDRLTGLSTSWQRRSVRLVGKLPGVESAPSVRVRFVADETNPPIRPVIEAAVDEVGIFAEAAACGAPVDPRPGGPDGGSDATAPPAEGCNCSVGDRAGAPPAWLALALVLSLGRWRASRRPGRS